MDTKWLRDEGEVLRRIAQNRQTLANTIHFVLDVAFQYPEHAFGQDILLGINVLRQKLGLSPDRKPGDIDYLIIPTRDGQPIVERTIAVEAKVVRPTLKSPNRNANSYGRSQVRGLLTDGFPFVGLLHIVVPEKLPKDLCWRVPKVHNDRFSSDGQLLETGEIVEVDPFPLLSSAKQEGRMKALELPAPVCYKAISFHLSQDGQRFCGNTINEERSGQPNPQGCKALRESISAYIAEHRDELQEVNWYDAAAS